MRKLFEDKSTLNFDDLREKRDKKKEAAQKFYSLLVLQKVRNDNCIKILKFKICFSSTP